jgi:alanine dehydrogenase
MHKITIGLPRMATQPGLRREFVPNFVMNLIDIGYTVWLENDYGSDLGFKSEDYPGVKYVDRKQLFTNADIVLFRASPVMSEIKLMRQPQILISKLHFPTHPDRNRIFASLGITVISLDETKDFEGKRMIQDFKSVAWSAITVAFKELKLRLGENYWFAKNRPPIGVYLLGVGAVGKEAMEGCIKMGNTDLVAELVAKGGNPLVEVIPTGSVHSKYKYWQNKFNPISIFQGGWPHLLIDASQRKNLSETVISQTDLKKLPPEALIVDITADCYDGSKTVKAIQGIPTGDESQYIFETDDPKWTDDNHIPQKFQLASEARRVTLSNYAWAGLGDIKDRIHNVQKYGNQILPFLARLEEMDLSHLDKYNSINWTMEKAVYQSTLDHFLKKFKVM